MKQKQKASCYRYTILTGQMQLLAFVVNISRKPIDSFTVDLEEPVSTYTDMMSQQETVLPSLWNLTETESSILAK